MIYDRAAHFVPAPDDGVICRIFIAVHLHLRSCICIAQKSIHYHLIFAFRLGLLGFFGPSFFASPTPVSLWSPLIFFFIIHLELETFTPKPR